MFIAIKDTKVIAFHEVEWQCRMAAKGIDKPSYWTWLESVTTVTGTSPDEKKTYDFSGEDYEIHEVDIDVDGLTQSGHIEGGNYHLSWDGSSVSADDDALATYQTVEKWKRVRSQRDALLSDTDWIVTKAKETGTNIPTNWKTYRQALRDVPDQTNPDDITWPTKPS